MIRTTQDDARENAQIKLFDLTPLQGRSNKYIPDATLIVDGTEHKIELKTSDVVKKQVSTARNVTLPKLDEYRKVHWVFSQYQKTEEGFEFTGEHYFARGSDLEPWLEKQKDKLLWGTKTYAGLGHWEQVQSLCEGQIDPTVIERLDNVLRKRAGLNDPKIGWATVKQLCTKIDPARPTEHLRELISQFNPN
jgi:hypothetical protein